MAFCVFYLAAEVDIFIDLLLLLFHFNSSFLENIRSLNGLYFYINKQI